MRVLVIEIYPKSNRNFDEHTVLDTQRSTDPDGNSVGGACINCHWPHGWPNAATPANDYAKLWVERWKTPQLVIHGELDYRVPYTEGLSLFTALQRQNVPSRFLYFPDEGHWINKPQNSALWYNTFLEWMGRWTK